MKCKEKSQCLVNIASLIKAQYTKTILGARRGTTDLSWCRKGVLVTTGPSWGQEGVLLDPSQRMAGNELSTRKGLAVTWN